MSLSTFKKYTSTSMIVENSLNDMEEQFNNVLQTVGSYMQVKFPLFKLPFDKLTICRVIDKPDATSQAQDTKKRITIVKPEINTMAVDANGNVFINQNFALEMWRKNKKHVVGVIVHEIMHVIYFHMHRFNTLPSVYDVLAHHPDTKPEDVQKLPRQPDIKVWNFATDYVINWYIRSMETKTGLLALPDEGLHAEPNTGKIPLDHLKQDVYILDDTGSPRKPEEIYVLLLRAGFYKEWQDQQSGDGSAGDGDGESGAGQAGDGVAEAEQRRFDDHIVDDTLVNEIKEQGGTPNKMDRKEWDVVVSKSANMAKDMERMAGTNDGGIYSVEVGEGKTNWRLVLKKYMESATAPPPVADWSRPRKRSYSAGAYLPRNKRDVQLTIPDVIVAIDTSGSTMGDQPRFLGEIVKLMSATKNNVRVLLWDDVVGNDITISSINGRPMWGPTGQAPTNHLNVAMPFEVTGGGGTQISSVAEYLAQQKPVIVPKVVIYLTDGYIENNPKLVTKAANLIVLTPGGSSAAFEGKPNTTIVNMD